MSERSRQRRRATKRLANWRAAYAPYPVGPGAKRRAKQAQREHVRLAEGARARAYQAYRARHALECPPPKDGVRSARAIRHKLSDGTELQRIMAPYRADARAAERVLEIVRGIHWRLFYMRRITFDIGAGDGGVAHQWRFDAHGNMILEESWTL